jgi:hypothetical protein
MVSVVEGALTENEELERRKRFDLSQVSSAAGL